MGYSTRLRVQISLQEEQCACIQQMLEEELENACRDAAKIFHINAAISSCKEYWSKAPGGAESLYELDFAALRGRDTSKMQAMQRVR